MCKVYTEYLQFTHPPPISRRASISTRNPTHFSFPFSQQICIGHLLFGKYSVRQSDKPKHLLPSGTWPGAAEETKGLQSFYIFTHVWIHPFTKNAQLFYPIIPHFGHAILNSLLLVNANSRENTFVASSQVTNPRKDEGNN